MEKQESQIEGFFVRRFNRLFPSSKDGLILKYTSSNYTGMPDRDIIVRGLPIIKIELKRPKGRLSPRQKYVHGVLKGLGVEVHTFDSKEEVAAFLDGLKEKFDLVNKA